MKAGRNQKSSDSRTKRDPATGSILNQAHLRYVERQLAELQRSGPQGESAYAALSRADERLRRLLEKRSPSSVDVERAELIEQVRKLGGPQPTLDYPPNRSPVFGLKYTVMTEVDVSKFSIYQGCASVPPMRDFASVTPSGPGISGTIATDARYAWGGVRCSGDLVAPAQSQDNPAVWLRAWKATIELPSFSSHGILDYHISTRAECFVDRTGGPFLQCYSTVGESSNHVAGRDIPAQADKCLWILDSDLRKDLPVGYGEVATSVMAPPIHRGTIAVKPGRAAAISLTIGIIAFVNQARLRLLWGNIGPTAYGPQNVECVAYRFEPINRLQLSDPVIARIFGH